MEIMALTILLFSGITLLGVAILCVAINELRKEANVNLSVVLRELHKKEPDGTFPAVSPILTEVRQISKTFGDDIGTLMTRVDDIEEGGRKHYDRQRSRWQTNDDVHDELRASIHVMEEEVKKLARSMGQLIAIATHGKKEADVEQSKAEKGIKEQGKREKTTRTSQ